MEKTPNFTEQVQISAEVRRDLPESDLLNYKKIKTEAKAVLENIWTPELSDWIDENLTFLGEIGKAVELMGKIKEKESTSVNLQTLEKYRSHVLKMMNKMDQSPEHLQTWIDEASPHEMKKAGDLFDQMSKVYLAAITKKATA